MKPVRAVFLIFAAQIFSLTMVQQRHTDSTGSLRDIVIGMGDGLSVSFALVAGMSVLFPESKMVAMIVGAVVLFQSVVMALSGWFSGRGEQAYYYSEVRRIENPEMSLTPEMYQQLELYESMGFPEEMRDPALAEISEGNKRWIEFLRRFGLQPSPGSSATLRSALRIGTTYALGGFIPLISFLLFPDSFQAVLYAVIFTLVSLFVLGYFKSRLMGVNPFSMAIGVVTTGAIAAACTYLVGLLVR